MSKHWIAMAGLCGYLPNYCEVASTKAQAIDMLAELCTHVETGNTAWGLKTALRRDHYFELYLHEYGNEYAEITECDCGDPGVHSDSGEYNE